MAGLPPSYRHPPPYLGGVCTRPPHVNATVSGGMANPMHQCPCCGEMNIQQPQWYPAAPTPTQGGTIYTPIVMQHQPPPMHHQMGQPRMMCPRSAQIGIPLRAGPPPPQGHQTPMLTPGGGGPAAAFMQPPNALPCFPPQSHPQQPQRQPPALFQHFPHPQGGWTLVGPQAVPNGGILKPGQMTSWVLQDGPIVSSSSAAVTPHCDIDDIKYGPFSDGEAEKCHNHYNSSRPRQNRSRSLPRRPASSMMVSYRPLNHAVPHYVTLSKSALVEAGEARLQQFEQQSFQFGGHAPPPGGVVPASAGGGGGIPPTPNARTTSRYGSQPSLNGILDFQDGGGMPNTVPPNLRPPVPKMKPKIKLSQKQPQQQQQPQGPPPKYQQPVSQQDLENSEYLFPDLPPPPDALLDTSNHTTSASPPSQLENSRCSSLDDLNWVTSAAEMSQALSQQKSAQITASQRRQDFHTNKKSYKSNTLPTLPSAQQQPLVAAMRPHQPTSIMKKRASNPVDPKRLSSGAIRIDLSSADKTIRRPGSEPDLKPASMQNSPMRSSIKTSETIGPDDPRRLSGISQGSSKKVMFSGVSDGESPSESNHDDDDVWVLQDFGKTKISVKQQPLQTSSTSLHPLDDDVPVTGVVIAQPQPCQYVIAAAAAAAQHQLPPPQQPHPILGVHAHSPIKMVKPPAVKSTPPPPPPRTTPVSTGGVAAVQQQQQQQLLQQQPHPQVVVPPQQAQQPQGGGAAGAGPSMRPSNPVLQRPAAQQFHESPDEGYHEDDNGSEVL